MSLMAKFKKHPALWVLGLGGAALAVDYFVEGDRSVASSLYRGIFGGHGGYDGRARGGHPAAASANASASPTNAALPGTPALPAYGEPLYYPAYPYSQPYGGYGYAHHDGHEFGHGGGHGFAHGGHAGHGGHGGGHGVRGYSWE